MLRRQTMDLGRMTDGSKSRPTCLVYLPLSYNGRGPGETCVRLVEQFASAGLTAKLFLPRARNSVPRGISLVQTLPPPLRRFPWRFASRYAGRSLDASFGAALRGADPSSTVAYFWPTPPRHLLDLAASRGIPIVREMINTAISTAKPILDAAYRHFGLEPSHPADASGVERERTELPAYDYISAPSTEVEESLVRMGIDPAKILRTSFAWLPSRFPPQSAVRKSHFRALFVGMIGVRKGVLELLDAWEEAGVKGELLLVGQVEPAVADRVAKSLGKNGVSHQPFTSDLNALYRSADVFIFPSREEGAPLVVYEAAGCGLPVITTPMGAARLVDHGTTGLIVAPGNVPELAAAIRHLADDQEARESMAAASEAAAAQFTFERVGKRRGELLREIALGRMPAKQSFG